MSRLKIYPGTVLITSLILSIASPITAVSHETPCPPCDCSPAGQADDFIVSAYYSPLPNQERYYLGSYEEDVRFNGEGLAGNDGTPVYPGMIAAPPEFPFGTVIELPRLGMTGTVHDRGGRIVTGEDGIPRIDVWMGEGEEGLARALEWGVQRQPVKVYYPEPKNVPKENFDFSALPAPEHALNNVPTNPVTLLDTSDPRYGDTSSEVMAIQYTLKRLGYFDHNMTGFFGDVTRDALATFERDVKEGGNGEIANDNIRRILIAHQQIRDELGIPVPGEETLVQGTSGKTVRILQRILGILELYAGEIDGIYDQELMGILYKYQKEQGIVTSLADTGAGIVGPQTRRALITAWRGHRINRRGGADVLVATL